MARKVALPILLIVAIVSYFPGAVAALAPTDPYAAGEARPAPRVAEAAAAFRPVTTPDPVVRWMIDQVKQDTVRQYDGDLSGEWPISIRGSSYRIQTRHTYSGTPIQNATYYAGDHMSALGLTVEYHDWGPDTAPNVIGQKTGTSNPGDIYMITAHLDDMPSGPTAPGADDNASGSVGVLVAADILSQFNWNCTIRFALWTGEEQGLLGSEKYAQRAKNNGENIVGVFNLDMIAWNMLGSAPDIDLHADSTRPRTVDLANQASSVIDAYDIALIPEVRGDGTGASDHASFWKYDYDAVLGIEDFYPNGHDFDPCYHKTSDTLSTLNLGYFAQYIKAAVAETAHMAGCLTTGTLQGQVLASHDNSPIANAEIKVSDSLGREYALQGGADGQYSQAVPPGAYSAMVSAYGYAPGTASGMMVPANGSANQDYVLAASAPAAAPVSISLDAGEVQLTWPHLSPDTAYQVHRSSTPYFTLDGSTLLAILDAVHPPAPGEALTYRDAASGTGDASVSHVYVVLAMNAAGSSAASERRGEFDYELVQPTSP